MLDSGDHEGQSFISKFVLLEPNIYHHVIGKLNTNASQVLLEIDPNLDAFTFASQLFTCNNVSLASSTREKPVSAETLARNWGIEIDVARQTRAATTQRGVRYVTPTMSKQFRTNN